MKNRLPGGIPRKPPGILEHCVTRRQFLFMGAATVGTVTPASVLPGRLFQAQAAAYDGMMVGRLSGLQVGEPVKFRYPWDHGNCDCYLIKAWRSRQRRYWPRRRHRSLQHHLPPHGDIPAGKLQGRALGYGAVPVPPQHLRSHPSRDDHIRPRDAGPSAGDPGSSRR